MIYVFLAEGFEEIEALTPVDLIRRAGFEVRTVAIGGDNKVCGAHGIPVITDIKDTEYCDIKPEVVILPGGMPGTLNLEESPTVQFALYDAMKNGGLVCAICAAPSILGKLGYLKDKNATCYPGFEQYLEGATLVDKQIVRDGNIITANGMGGATEFALAIVEAIAGKEKAEQIAKSALIK
jgi:4-methyl-5(b-hydroxyethyl)-thiazole monophosphate biosynthesis